MAVSDGLESVSVRRARENVAGSGVAGLLVDQVRRGVWTWDEMLLLSQVVVGGEWRERAACRGMDVELFFPERGKSTVHAKRVCASCPVQVECGEYAREAGESFGVWGGSAGRLRRSPKPKSVGCVLCGGRMRPEGKVRTPLCSDECRVGWNRMRHAAARLRQSQGVS